MKNHFEKGRCLQLPVYTAYGAGHYVSLFGQYAGTSPAYTTLQAKSNSVFTTGNALHDR